MDIDKKDTPPIFLVRNFCVVRSKSDAPIAKIQQYKKYNLRE